MAKKVLIIDAGVHQGFAQGELNHHYAQVAQETLTQMGYSVEITRVEDDYDVATEAGKVIAADYIIIQTPGFWMSIPWQLKKYLDYVFCDPRIAKGDFIRMKEISLSYDFPKKLISKIRLSSLSLKLQATNLFLIYADKKLNGQDPEFYNTGGVAAPVPRQFTLTVRIGL